MDNKTMLEFNGKDPKAVHPEGYHELRTKDNWFVCDTGKYYCKYCGSQTVYYKTEITDLEGNLENKKLYIHCDKCYRCYVAIDNTYYEQHYGDAYSEEQSQLYFDTYDSPY